MTASKIEWTDRSDWNPIRGCTRVSEGCRNCYAEGIAARFSGPGQPFHGFAERTPKGPRWTGKVELVEDRLTLPLRWRKPARIFASSTSDIFHESLPDEAIDRIFAVMALAPQHTFQVLTKRPERMRAYVADLHTKRVLKAGMVAIDGKAVIEHYADPADFPLWKPLPNVWLGVSVEDQATADERIPHLLATPAARRFLSCEPLLGAVDLETAWHGENALDSECWGECGWCPKGLPPLHNCQQGRQSAAEFDKGRSGIDWVIVGGESGPNARPMHPDWARSLRDQCQAAGVPFFFKQWGEWWPANLEAKCPSATPDDAAVRDMGDGQLMFKVGKARAGRLLDGREWSEFPA